MTYQYLSPEERTELDTLLDEVLNGDRTVTAERVLQLDHYLQDAVQAQREWAVIMTKQARLVGLRRLLTNRAKSESVALVSHHNEIVSKTLRVGRRVKAQDGRKVWQQALLEDFSWVELMEWLEMMRTQVSALLVNTTMAERLLSLREQFPDSRGPADACRRLGTTVAGFLGAEAA